LCSFFVNFFLFSSILLIRREKLEENQHTLMTI
jgi:hypothetical protein